MRKLFIIHGYNNLLFTTNREYINRHERLPLRYSEVDHSDTFLEYSVTINLQSIPCNDALLKSGTDNYLDRKRYINSNKPKVVRVLGIAPT